jgi:hypothetical protein
MKLFTFILLSLLSLAVSTLAQQTQSPATQAHSKNSPSPSACKTLATTAALVDDAFDGKSNESRMLAPMLSDPDDPIWNVLIECSEATKKPSQSAEALRVAAMWERLRAQNFEQKYTDIKPVAASSCKDLDKLEWRVKTFNRQLTPATTSIAPDYEQVLNELNSCAKESRERNKEKPGTEGARAQFMMTSWDSTNKAIELRRLSRDYDEVLADDTALVGKFNSLVGSYNDL